MRSLGVVVFIGLIAGVAIYFAQKPTVARGDVLAAQLLEANKKSYPPILALDCDRTVPIGLQGADFSCMVEFKNGDKVPYKFRIDREGRILTMNHGETQRAPQIKKTSDPWGD